MLKSVVLNEEEFGLHSLCSSGISIASRRGVFNRLIASHGGWRSYQSYDGNMQDNRNTVYLDILINYILSSKSAGLEKEDALNRVRWRVGVGEIAVRVG